MKRYDFTSDDVCYSGCRIEEFDDGEYVKWEDVKEIEKLGFKSYGGYIQMENVATDMAVSLHQRFYADTATLRFRTRDCKSIIIDVDMNAFKKFMENNSMNLKCNCEENAFAGLKPDGSGIARSIFWICPVHGYKRR